MSQRSALGHAVVVALELEELGYRYLITDQHAKVTIHVVTDDGRTLGRDVASVLDIAPGHVARMLVVALDPREPLTV